MVATPLLCLALSVSATIALFEKDLVTRTYSLFIVKRLLSTWVLEVLDGRFDNDKRLEGGGKWVCYKDFQGHTTWEWIKDKGNRDLANKTGLINIRGDEPDASEIGGLIKQTGLPVESKRMDENTAQPEVSKPEVSNYYDGKVGQKSVQGVPSNTLLYKNIEHPPAQKNVPLSKQPREYLHSIDPSTRLTPPKATDSLDCLIFDWLVARLKDLVGLKVLDDWRAECTPDADFKLVELCQGKEYQDVLANETAFNKAKLGAQIKDGAISPKGLGALLRRFGFNYSSKRVNKGSKAKPADDKSKRTQVTYYRLVPSQEPEFLRENLARRAGELYYKKAAQEWHDQKAQEIAEYGAPLIPDRSVSQATARFTIRFWILYLLHIVSNGRGGYKCEPDAVFKLECIVNDMQDFVSRHKDVVNRAGLGAQVGNEGLTVKILSLWIKAMGIDLSLKKIDACKLLINKDAKNASPDNTGGDPLLKGSKGEADHPNKTAGVENNVCKNNGLKTTKREMVRVFSVNPKCLQKVREIMDKDEHERENELMAQILDKVKTAPPIDVQASIKGILDDADCQDLPSVLAQLDMLDGLSDDVYDRISGLLVEFASGVAYDKGGFLDRVSELAQKYPAPKPWGTAV
jgi:hypothetical protein